MVSDVYTLTKESAWGEALQAARRVTQPGHQANLLLCIWRATKETVVLKELRETVEQLDPFGGIELRTTIALETGNPQDFQVAQNAARASDQCRASTAIRFVQGGKNEEAQVLVGEISDPSWLTSVLCVIAKTTKRTDDFEALLTAVQKVTGFNENFGLSVRDMELRRIVTEWVALATINFGRVELDRIDFAAEAAKLISHPGPRAEAFISIAHALAAR